MSHGCRGWDINIEDFQAVQKHETHEEESLEVAWRR